MAVSLSISITQNSQSVANNTSNVTVAVKASWTYGSYNKNSKSGWVKIDGTTYSFTSSFNTGQSTSGSQTICTKTVNVAHATNGTKTLSCSASYTTGVSSGTITASASKALTTIPRKSTMSVANGTLNTAQTLTVTRQSTSFTHTITATCGTASSTICTKSTSTSISFTPPIAWASQNTTATSVSVTYTITTYNGTTDLGSNSYTVTCAIPSTVKPSCSIAVSDPTGYLTTFGGYVQGKSKFAVTVTPTLSYGSPIATYNTAANGSTYTASTFTTGTLSASGTNTISATVTDKRGRTGTASKTATVLAYSAPKITTLTVIRCDSAGTENAEGAYFKATMVATATSLNSKNTTTYTLKYKKSSATSWTSVSVGTANTYSLSASKIIAADTGSSYDVQLAVKDYFTTTTASAVVSTAFTLMHFKADGTAMAIGKMAETSNMFDIGIPIGDTEVYSGKQVSRGATGSTYVKGRDSAMLRQDTVASSTSYNPFASIKTQNGSWEIGTYTDDTLHFVYLTDANYTSDTNTVTRNITFNPLYSLGLQAYPVGAIYISYVSTSPASLFGGTWTAITGRFPYFNAGTATGGSNTHTLTVAQIPAHNHQQRVSANANSGGTGIRMDYNADGSGYTEYNQGIYTANTGGGESHNNMPAYQTLYAWRRTA